MSRRAYDTYEDEREYYVPSGHSRRGDRTVYAEEEEVHVRRRAPPSEPDFLREDYGRREAGPLVVREKERERSRERPRRREVVEEDVVIDRGSKPRERPREREVVEDDVIISRGPRERLRREEKVELDEREVVYRPREREPQIRSEREEFVYRRERDREREYDHLPPPIRSEREEYIFRAPKVREPSPEPERTEISIRERSRGPPRERYRDDDEEIIIRNERSRGPPRERYRDEEDEVIIKREDRSRAPPRGRDRDFEEEITLSERDRRQRPRAASYERESLTISTGEREKPRARSNIRGEEQQIIIRRNEGQGRSRAKSRGGYDEDDNIIIRRGALGRERPRERSRETHKTDYDDITFKHDDSNGRHKDEIIIRRERSPSPEPVKEPPPPPPPPEPVRAPPIVQEVITHHRHIDHGFERAPAPEPPPRARTPPPPPRPRSPSPVRDERIEIRHSGSRNGRHYDDDIIFERETGGRRQLDGVRRSERVEEEPERQLTVIENRDVGRRFEAQTSSRDRMWTEITKNLVSEEAIKEKGYEYEESGEFYYVMEYLRYEDVLELVEITEDIKRDRRERIREIQVEREFVERPRRSLPPPPQWDEERVVEREIIYDRPPPRRYR